VKTVKEIQERLAEKGLELAVPDQVIKVLDSPKQWIKINRYLEAFLKEAQEDEKNAQAVLARIFEIYPLIDWDDGSARKEFKAIQERYESGKAQEERVCKCAAWDYHVGQKFCHNCGGKIKEKE
jgi:phytoene dehydrogenase-like protein